MEDIYELEAAKLRRCVESKKEITIYTINGYQIRCRMVGFDRNVIAVMEDGAEKMVYRHAVSTITIPKA